MNSTNGAIYVPATNVIIYYYAIIYHLKESIIKKLLTTGIKNQGILKYVTNF